MLDIEFEGDVMPDRQETKAEFMARRYLHWKHEAERRWGAPLSPPDQEWVAEQVEDDWHDRQGEPREFR